MKIENENVVQVIKMLAFCLFGNQQEKFATLFAYFFSQILIFLNV